MGTDVQAEEGCEMGKAPHTQCWINTTSRNTPRGRENSGLGEGASEYRKRSKFTMVLASDHAARTTIQPPAM